MRFIHFDIRATRSKRLKTDKFALVSTVLNKFIENCNASYISGAYLTVDEKLYKTKCRCSFIQYMANKPDKFGIKYWMLGDVESNCNVIPYLGKDDQQPQNESFWNM